MSPDFEELVTRDHLPQDPLWSGDFEYSKIHGTLSPQIFSLLTKISFIGLFISGAFFYLNRGGLSFFGLIITGTLSALFFGWPKLWGKDLIYFQNLKNICQGQDLVFSKDALYISGLILVSNRHNWHFSLRDREKLRMADAHYLKIPIHRLKAFGRWRQFLALYPSDGAAFTKYFFFESFNERFLEELVSHLSKTLPQEELNHWEIPIPTQVANY